MSACAGALVESSRRPGFGDQYVCGGTKQHAGCMKCATIVFGIMGSAFYLKP